MSQSEVTEQAERYYDSSDADEFYHQVWGGEDIHVGCYQSDVEPIAVASRRTVERMAELCSIDASTHIIDWGSGYGGAARQLVAKYGCRVTCLNLSETQNRRNIEKTRDAGMSDRIQVVHGAFEALPFYDACCELVWSQDAFLHSPERDKVFKEARRVLKRGGSLIFTDPMQADSVPEGVLDPVLQRIHLASLGSFAEYRRMAQAVGLRETLCLPLTEQLTRHYTRVREELSRVQGGLKNSISEPYLERMLEGLGHWIDAGRAGHLAWGILKFEPS
jgi:sarcosine/dimethylglycine N-methyltransferase